MVQFFDNHERILRPQTPVRPLPGGLSMLG